MRKQITKTLLIFMLFGCCSTSAQAEEVNYLGCNWVIPDSFEKIGYGEYSKLDDDLKHSAIGFQVDDDPDRTFIHDVLMDETIISHYSSETTDVDMVVDSLFIHRKGTEFFSFLLIIRKEGNAVSLTSGTYEDAAKLAMNCIDEPVLSLLYEQYEQWVQNILLSRSQCSHTEGR